MKFPSIKDIQYAFTLSKTEENDIDSEIYLNKIIGTKTNNQSFSGNNEYKVYTLEKIKSILEMNNFPEEIIEKINTNIIMPKVWESVYLFKSKMKLIGKKRNNPVNNENRINEEKEDKKKGRTSLENNDDRVGIHSKDSPDNIIKKCKALFFSCVIDYIQKYLNDNKIKYKEKIKLLKLDYTKYVIRIKKEIELELLDKPLKDIASLEISSRYRANKDKDLNKKIIEKVIDDEKGNDKIIKLLNMSFSDWIDIFTMKKNLDDSFEFFGLQSAFRIMGDKNDDIYLSKFIFYLFNYKAWFKNKKGRNRSNNDIDTSINK